MNIYKEDKAIEQRGRRGFTLIELLVVIAIIAILAAILFPVFAAAREKARQTTCNSNMKQLGLAIAQYTQDYDEFLPREETGSNNWAFEIYPYVKSVAVYACPDDTTTTSNPALNKCSYCYNLNLEQSFGVNFSTSIAKMNSPSLSVALCEVGQGGMLPNTGDYSPYGDGFNQAASGGMYRTGYMGSRNFNFTPGATLNPNIAAHTAGSNFLACDGHVKWLHGEQVSNGQGLGSQCNGTQAQGQNNFACAAATSVMKDLNGNSFVMTFSPL
jgi:prepilin-type N-terminal cleavage/methylation domain-containing protein/prepilin-type processing-associated H-X9-DG protein